MRAFVHRQWRQFATIFRPPFTGMWVAFLLYFVWCFLVYPHSQTLRADLPDSDDYMYLTQVLDWLRGQGWYNNIQHRLDPPVYGIGGDPIPFSRLPQIPMAALTLFFEWLGLGPTGAATVGALIWPPCLLAGFFMALRWLAAAFVPRDWAGASAFVLIFAPPTLFLFMPGHVDHHGLDLLLTTLALGGAVHMIREPEKPGWALIAGLMLALDLAIALEILPWLILTGAAVALWAMVEGRAAARSGLAFGLALFLGSALLLALAKPPAAFFAPDLLGYSIVYVLFTASIALVLAGIALVADDRLGWRMLAGLGLAGASAWLFFGRFPALLSGPFGAVNPILAKLMLNGLNESEALAKAGRTWPWIISRTLNGWLGLGIALYALWRARGRDLWLWGLVGALVATAILLTVFYQFRFITALGVFAAVPLTVLLQRGWRRIGASLKGRGKMLAEIGLLLVVGPLTTV
ncbi:MAG TPA: hypothetical protein VMV79_03580, partial [Alphaproteobacteria bacterium]|nr:hypothetical protein [Alphaproteobacteria bacterium]